MNKKIKKLHMLSRTKPYEDVVFLNNINVDVASNTDFELGKTASPVTTIIKDSAVVWESIKLK